MTVQSFHLEKVRINGGPLKRAMDLNGAYLLELEPDRLLSRFHEYAGLSSKAPHYGGWEERGISGHTLGHYLSACAMMAAATGDLRFKDRVDYIVAELKRCQDAHGDGYVSGIPRGKELFSEVQAGDIRTKGFDLNGGWVPLYTMHKLFAGLRDAYQLTGSDKALEIERKLGLWMERIFAGLNDDQMQQVLHCEFGGMNEVLADLGADIRDDRFLALADRFYHKGIMEPLAEGCCELNGRHANTQIPKVVGAARQYELTGNEKYRRIAKNFWGHVVHHHSYVIGGHSLNEHFGLPSQLNNRLGAGTCETCNSYNMLKLTKHLFEWEVLAEAADFYERAMYNHILGSQHKEDGSVCYFVSLDMGGYKDFRPKFEQFSCCIGSGMENHALYGNALYFHDERSLFVCQYAPSTLDWSEMGVSITQETSFPEEGRVLIKLKCKEPVCFALRVRYPHWAKMGMSIRVNGWPQEASGGPSSFVTIDREWQNDDVVELDIPMTVHIESMPDNSSRIAFLYGPLVLAGNLGELRQEQEEKADDMMYTPVLIGDLERLTGNIVPSGEHPAVFRMKDLGYPRDVDLVPFYRMYDRRYSVYWDVFSPERWAHEEAGYKADMEEFRRLERLTVDFVQPGEMQPERDHSFQGTNTRVGILFNRKYRESWLSGWFSFVLRVLPDQTVDLVVMYSTVLEAIDCYELTVDGHPIGEGTASTVELDKFVRMTYRVSEKVTTGKQQVTVKFAAHPEKKVSKIFGIRTVRTDGVSERN